MFVDGELYAVDVAHVLKVAGYMDLTPLPAAPYAVAGIANLKGGIVTLLNLTELLGNGRRKQADYAVIFKPVVDGYGRMGLLVDNLGGLISIEESEIIPLRPLAEDQDAGIISGLAEPEGRLYRIIDIFSVIRKYE